ncbi:hypothetical protein K426_18995 [Sphingobium sp. TKS]|nr:hypothetical protein K426_18995 [Sphingobium sp. TKS]
MDRASLPSTPTAPGMSGAGRICRLSSGPFDTMSAIAHSNHVFGNPAMRLFGLYAGSRDGSSVWLGAGACDADARALVIRLQ